ncbi:MAG: UPF0182 family protein [Patescibacteria group bacterium]
MLKNKNTYKIALIALIVLGFFLLPAIAGLYANIAWYKGVGFYSVFIIPFLTRIIIGVAGFILITGILLLNFKIFNKLSRGKLYVSQTQSGTILEQPKEVGGIVKKGFTLLSIFIGLIAGLALSGNWETVLKYIYRVPFGTTDPVLGYDLSYYVFTLPFVQLVAGMLFFLLAACLIFTAILYAWHILYHHYGQRVKYLGFFSLPFIPETAKKHLTVLGMGWFLLTAFYLYAISLPNLLLSRHELLSGADYVDIHARLPVTYGLMGVSLLIVVAGAYMILRKKYGLWGPMLALYMAILILGGGLYPSLLQSLVVAPNELSKEETNLTRHISATREAWGLDEVDIKKLSGAQELTMKDIEENEGTIDNIRLWDRGPLLDTFSQLQEIRTYYTFNSLDTERYRLNGEYQQLSLAPRELDDNNLPKRNFINEKLTYTHGMGAAVTPINQVTSEGLPALYVKDLPPTSTEEKLDIEQPAIYYGEKQSDYVIANTKSKEFHYPGQEGNVYQNYTGSGGVLLDSSWKKALMAINFGSYKIFLNSDIMEESRMLYHRNINGRIEKALPFLSFDSDPYLVIADGNLKWIRDAYTTTDHYPYSAEMDGINYMRNSVKVVVDAYEGDINAYVMDKNDPLIQSYASIFPKVFRSAEDMPSAVKEHIRYPEDLFSKQSVLYTEYHMDDIQNFYNKEDMWTFPRLMSTSRGEGVGPIMRRLIMKLPGKAEEEFVLMLPYTPEGKNNMISWIAARSDGDNYGELINYRFPKDSLAYGPQQIISRINQRTEISRQTSLWDQRGSEVLQGNLYVIPIEESILYVRPLYLRARDSRMPELKRVIVAHKENIAMEPTLDQALQAIFGNEGKSDPEKESGQKEEKQPQIQPEIKELVGEANQLFERSLQAQQQGDWSGYGNILDQLKDRLNELQSRTE